MTEPLTGISAASAQAADAMQAAYFRGVLADHRAHLEAALTKVRSQAETHEEAGNRFEVHRLRRQVREHNFELSQVDWLISGLDRRYTQAWADLRAEIF
ncbi:MAG TPA: hypothetical protein VH185_05860 [Mycobacterium sp.]|nr:hypothetical protein [Mycobacterium sp.]